MRFNFLSFYAFSLAFIGTLSADGQVAVSQSQGSSAAPSLTLEQYTGKESSFYGITSMSLSQGLIGSTQYNQESDFFSASFWTFKDSNLPNSISQSIAQSSFGEYLERTYLPLPDIQGGQEDPAPDVLNQVEEAFNSAVFTVAPDARVVAGIWGDGPQPLIWREENNEYRVYELSNGDTDPGFVLSLSGSGDLAAGTLNNKPVFWTYDTVNDRYIAETLYMEGTDSHLYGGITAVSNDGKTAIGVTGEVRSVGEDELFSPALSSYIWKKTDELNYSDVTPEILSISSSNQDSILNGETLADIPTGFDVFFSPYGIELHALSGDGSIAVGRHVALIQDTNDDSPLKKYQACVYTYNTDDPQNPHWDGVALDYNNYLDGNEQKQYFYSAALDITHDGSTILGLERAEDENDPTKYSYVIWQKYNDNWNVTPIEGAGSIENGEFRFANTIESYDGKLYVGGMQMLLGLDNGPPTEVDDYLWVIDNEVQTNINLNNAKISIFDGAISQYDALSLMSNNLDFQVESTQSQSSYKGLWSFAAPGNVKSKLAFTHHAQVAKMKDSAPMLLLDAKLSPLASYKCKPTLGLKFGHALDNYRGNTFNYKGLQSRAALSVDYAIGEKYLITPSFTKLWVKANFARLSALADTEHASGDARIHGESWGLLTRYQVSQDDHLNLSLTRQTLTRAGYTEEGTVTPITYTKNKQRSSTLKTSYHHHRDINTRTVSTLSAHASYMFDTYNNNLGLSSMTFPGLSAGVTLESPQPRRLVMGAQATVEYSLQNKNKLVGLCELRQSYSKDADPIWKLSIAYTF